MLKRLDQARQAVIWGLWLVLLASIPITSFPLVAGLLGKNPVSPLALIPLVLLAVALAFMSMRQMHLYH